MSGFEREALKGSPSIDALNFTFAKNVQEQSQILPNGLCAPKKVFSGQHPLLISARGVVRTHFLHSAFGIHCCPLDIDKTRSGAVAN